MLDSATERRNGQQEHDPERELDFRWNGVVVNGTVTLPSGNASIGFRIGTLPVLWLPNASGTLTLYTYLRHAHRGLWRGAPRRHRLSVRSSRLPHVHRAGV